jgi:hypothetical protein
MPLDLWFTKIRPLKIRALADKLKSGLNENQVIMMCVFLNFLVCGFLAGYLRTRLFLAEAFTIAERTEFLLGKGRKSPTSSQRRNNVDGMR